MIGDHRVLGFVPARKGSKRLPRKNLALLGGKPLLLWTLEQAQAASVLDDIIVSSDDEDVLALARGCLIHRRSPELADDKTRVVTVLRHVMATLTQHYDYVVVLPPTSPLRITADIEGCLATCHEFLAPGCVSVSPAGKNSYWLHTRDDVGRLQPLVSRPQGVDLRTPGPPVYTLSGAVFAVRWDWIAAGNELIGEETLCYVVPWERSIDVDTAFDLSLAEAILQADLRGCRHGTDP